MAVENPMMAAANAINAMSCPALILMSAARAAPRTDPSPAKASTWSHWFLTGCNRTASGCSANKREGDGGNTTVEQGGEGNSARMNPAAEDDHQDHSQAGQACRSSNKYCSGTQDHPPLPAQFRPPAMSTNAPPSSRCVNANPASSNFFDCTQRLLRTSSVSVRTRTAPSFRSQAGVAMPAFAP